MDIESQKEIYLTQAVEIELGEIHEPPESDRTARLHFWQSLSSADRFDATSEIVRRVHLAKGGSEADLTVNRSIAGLVKVKK